MLQQVTVVKDVGSNPTAADLEKTTFTYDYVFKEDTPQPLVYEQSVSDLVRAFVDGYNATILAYGQTVRIERVQNKGKNGGSEGGGRVCTSDELRTSLSIVSMVCAGKW